MNILFVYSVDDIELPDRPLRTSEEMQFGISYISALLKKHGHDTKLVVLSRLLGRKNNLRLDTCIEKFAPRVICFTAVTSEYPFIAGIARHVRSRFPDPYLIVGGAHVSLNPENVLSDGFDALCIGEGEYPTLELVSRIENDAPVTDIPNLRVRVDGAVESNPPRPFLQDLDNLPLPDRQMWQEWVSQADGPEAAVLLGRGCPFQCTYCCNHSLRKLAGGMYVRLRSPERIVDEIRAVIAQYPGKKAFYLEVETIGADREWAMDLCSKLKVLNRSLDRPLSFGTNLRVTPAADLESLFAAFKDSNFKFIKIGVESGSERVRSRILKRNYSNRDIVRAAEMARRYGLEVSFYNLLGVPGETVADFEETVALNRECQPDKTFAHIFFPYPGTELYDTCVCDGLLKGLPDTALERCRATLDLPGFSRKQIQRGFVWFDYGVYKGYRPMRKILAKVFVSKCRSSERLHYLYRSLTCSRAFRWLKAELRRCV